MNKPYHYDLKTGYQELKVDPLGWEDMSTASVSNPHGGPAGRNGARKLVKLGNRLGNGPQFRPSHPRPAKHKTLGFTEGFAWWSLQDSNL